MVQALTDLSTEETAAIAYVSVIFGGLVWTGLSKMFDNLSGVMLDNVIILFCALLQNQFSFVIAKWICNNWRFLEEQTLGLLRYLNDSSSASNEKVVNDIVAFSKAVHIDNLASFVLVVGFVIDRPPFRLMLSLVSSAPPAQDHKIYQKMFEAIVGEITTSENQPLITRNQQKLKELPLSQWLTHLKQWKESAFIDDADSVQNRLDELKNTYKINSSKKELEDLKGTLRYEMIFGTVKNGPNNL